MRNRFRVLSVIIALACMLCAATSIALADDWQLEVVSGDSSIVLTAQDVTAMESLTVRGAMFRSSVGRVEGPFSYTVVPVMDILAKVGGIRPDQALRVTARDDFSELYSYAQLAGNVVTFDDKGKVFRVGGPEMFLAYSSDRDGPERMPRIVFTSRDGYTITKGHLWAKMVSRLEVVWDVDGWQLQLDGVDKVLLDRNTFQSVFMCSRTPYPVAFWVATGKDGSTSQYQGTPLWAILSMMDGCDAPEGNYEFNDELAQKGYMVRIVSKDGFAAELDSRTVARNNSIILAYSKNGEYLEGDEAPLCLVGELPGKRYSVKGVTLIQIIGGGQQ